jgi:hypothetical protein
MNILFSACVFVVRQIVIFADLDYTLCSVENVIPSDPEVAEGESRNLFKILRLRSGRQRRISPLRASKGRYGRNDSRAFYEKQGKYECAA